MLPVDNDCEWSPLAAKPIGVVFSASRKWSKPRSNSTETTSQLTTGLGVQWSAQVHPQAGDMNSSSPDKTL